MALITYHAADSPIAMADILPLSVDDTGITVYTLGESRSGVAFQVVSGDEVWFGGSTTVSATSERGNILYPRGIIMLTNVQAGFTIGFRCAATKSCTVGIVETL
jgi:hypothetical protein